jgi:hypothetical protein
MNACRYCKVVSRIRNVLRVALFRENQSNYSFSTDNVTHTSFRFIFNGRSFIKLRYDEMKFTVL